MQYGKTKLFHLLANSPRTGWTTQKIKDLIDSLWRDTFDSYVTSADWDDELNTLTLHRNNNLDDIEVPVYFTAAGSIVGDGSSLDPYTLDNDLDYPGTNRVYATNASGQKGWWPLFADDSGSSGSASSSGGGITALFANLARDWIEFEFRDIEAGTAADYVLDLKALVPYTIDSAVMQVDTGSLTGVAIKIGTTAVTGLSSVTVDTDIDETTATASNSVAAGNKVILAVGTGYSGAPTLIRGKLNLTRT